MKAWPVEEKQLASTILDSWKFIVDSYFGDLKSAFAQLRDNRADRFARFTEVRREFHSLLARADENSSTVAKLQQSINEIPQDMRYDDRVKAELHQRVKDAVNAMHTVVMERKAAAAEQLQAVQETALSTPPAATARCAVAVAS